MSDNELRKETATRLAMAFSTSFYQERADKGEETALEEATRLVISRPLISFARAEEDTRIVRLAVNAFLARARLNLALEGLEAMNEEHAAAKLKYYEEHATK